MVQENIGIDTSTLGRLATYEPPDTHAHREYHLRERASKSVKVFASNWVIGEGYVNNQIHYGFMEEELDFIINYDIK